MFTNEQYTELTFEEKKEVMSWKAKFHEKKANVTAQIQRIKKNGYNSFHKYAYATESDVKDGIREILNSNKLSITNDLLSRTEVLVKTTKGEATKTDIQMRFTLIDTETGYFESFVHDGVAVDNSDKGIYKAYSNTIKYFLMDMFLIPTGDDVEKDGPEISPQGAPQGRQNNQQGNQSQNNGKKPEGSKELKWQSILDGEKKLQEVSGKSQAEIRSMLKDNFGELGKYKDMDQDKIKAILAKLAEAVRYYTNPQ